MDRLREQVLEEDGSPPGATEAVKVRAAGGSYPALWLWRQRRRYCLHPGAGTGARQAYARAVARRCGGADGNQTYDSKNKQNKHLTYYYTELFKYVGMYFLMEQDSFKIVCAFYFMQ